ncbi:MAG: hypothetical protein ACIAQ0_14475 [Phycisphaerales bacterium JB058]
MTYSWALNIGLNLGLESGIRPSKDLLIAMNQAREKRNELMHEATFNMERVEMDKLLTDTQLYIEALNNAENAINKIPSESV